MQAVILAAGMGRRLKEHTKDKTKCMVNVGGQTIIERGLRILDAKGLSRIVIVTGYKSEGPSGSSQLDASSCTQVS